MMSSAHSSIILRNLVEHNQQSIWRPPVHPEGRFLFMQNANTELILTYGDSSAYMANLIVAIIRVDCFVKGVCHTWILITPHSAKT